jgi:hypothetical protein
MQYQPIGKYQKVNASSEQSQFEKIELLAIPPLVI